ncbi:MAG: hypothetical protein LBI28_01340 [Treponema sp.]|jgi:hypothetical protein|nr:hypothetical protein [Treponema sp.]
MKRFKECFEAFILYLKNIENCPKFMVYQFSLEYSGGQVNNKQYFDIIKAEEIFNSLLDKGHSWLHIEYDKIVNNCLFTTFVVSKAYDSNWVGKTTVKFFGPPINCAINKLPNIDEYGDRKNILGYKW